MSPKHVREFVKPEPMKLVIPGQQTPPGQQPATMTYSFQDYLGEHVWGYAKWNEDGWDEAQIRLGELIEATAPGALVCIESLDDFEKLREANKAADIRGPLAFKVRKFQRAIKSARAPNEGEQ
jgi:hypothetical protein